MKQHGESKTGPPFGKATLADIQTCRDANGLRVPRQGYAECLGAECDRWFWSEDLEKIHFCLKCTGVREAGATKRRRRRTAQTKTVHVLVERKG